ncbi:MAG: peptide MFS transporter [Phycisphaerae bacterium]|nr:peptide MFS transporter [Phycisphaerae bacterium]
MEAVARREFLGHPVGLFVLFFTELWERFSYYGMRALLQLFLVKAWLMADKDASTLYGAYNGLVYLTPLFGGMIADRYLGYRNAITFGGLMMAAGQFCMMAHSGWFSTKGEQWIFFAGLGLMIIGNGFFKPNISAMVGKLYGFSDARRDGAFTIFYMGINIGAFLAPLICGWIGETWGWHYGFMLAGSGMLLGLVVFQFSSAALESHGFSPKPDLLWGKNGGIPLIFVIILGSLLAAPAAAYLVKNNHIVDWAMPIMAIGFVLFVIFEAMRCTPVERGRIFVILVLVIFSVTFWALFEQAGSSINLFTDRNVNRVVMGKEVPASVFQSVNALMIIVLAPLFSILWVQLRRMNANPSAPLKFALALLQIGLGFYILILGIKAAGPADGAKTALFWLVMMYLLHTTGELCLSPVGLSMVTRLSPPRLVGLMMGIWFLSSAFAHHLGGQIAALTGKEAGYEKVFMMLVYLSTACGVVLLILTPWLRWLMSEDVDESKPKDPALVRGAKPATAS